MALTGLRSIETGRLPGRMVSHYHMWEIMVAFYKTTR